MNPGEGASVPAGQPVQFEITLIGSCPAPGTYTIRADITDPATSTIISTGRGQLTANGQFIGTLTESVLAPSTIGRWVLQLSAYILLDGQPVAPASQLTFGLNVVPYIPASTVATTTQTTAVESATSYSIESTSTQTSATIFSTVSSQSQGVTPTKSNFETEIQLMAAALVLLVVIALFIRSRLRRAKTEETRVY